ncbi:MAG: hypothetical protein L0312_21475 [Acidobacteria bacterium]|nr:hypothetical protein [Acidobacteriota bacterium]
MTDSDRDFCDDDLRNRFAKLRLEEEAQAPKFVLLPPGGARHGHQQFYGRIAVAVCLVAMAAAVFLQLLVPPKTERELGKPVASLLEWRAPTDFLLETAGRELLRTVPTIGEWHDYAPRPKQKHPQARKQALP